MAVDEYLDVQNVTLYDEGEQWILCCGYCLALWHRLGLQLLPAMAATSVRIAHCYRDAARSG